MTDTKQDAGIDVFGSEIDSAIDDLFNPSKRIEIDPVTGKVIDVKTQSGAPHAPEPPAPDILHQIPLQSPSQPMDELIEKCQQHLLTLEWEVTDTNILLFKEELSRLLSALDPDKKRLLGDMPRLMDRILDLMLASPGTMSMNGLKAMQKGVDAIKDMISGGTLWFELLTSSINKLNEELSPVPGHPDQPSDRLQGPPQGDKSTMPAAEEAKGQPMEMAELELELEEDFQKAGASAPQSAEAISIAPMVRETLDSHVDALNRCIARMVPVEDLMAQTPGMEKLCTFYRGIREDLEQQLATLLKEMPELERPMPHDEIRPETSEKTTAAPLQADTESAAKKTIVAQEGTRQVPADRCPWQRLAMTSWSGKTVAFVPSEIAFEGKPAWWARKKIRRLDAMPLKMLKTWPWTRLRSLLNGELAKKDEAELREIEIDIAAPPWPAPAATDKEPIVIVLYDGDKDRATALLVDSETILFPAQGNWVWVPSEEKAHYAVGEIKNDQGESIPLISAGSIAGQ
ncbi:hypothetical protein [Dissulfurimicrobium hydrothermale]|uniref:hypothetical protein n=1 Tax=Dissulfurimicrobium hydrothermale TaxID=1750598 RepID=UPI001EDB22A1|nr:hypothetical protein [Dissulfurimicrobium hydrothermale]UKL14253.1 hypothetical protein LGS26_03095 [Dissulfurimicrobium hydrothermale]